MGPMSQPARATFDDSCWPLLRLLLTGTLSARGHEECLATLGDYVQRREKFLLLVDVSRVGLVPLDQRWRQVEWLEEHEELLRETVLGSAVVLTSPVVRLSISAILFFKPLPIPSTTFATREEAEAWAVRRLEEEGLTQAGKGR